MNRTAEPLYLALTPAGLSQRAGALRALASPCRLCPRGCGVERQQGEQGFCGAGLRPWVASVGPHYGEERVLVGSGGSGTVFFSGCVLRCVFCQNHDISQEGAGEEVSPDELARGLLALQRLGCHSINFVTPTHQAPQLVETLTLARDRGLSIPVVWNCGGYESIEALRLLEGVVDIYMPDIKYGDSKAAAQYSAAPQYWEVAKEAVREMHRQVGGLRVERGIAVRGLLVRHLVLPGDLAGSEEVLRFLAQDISPHTFVNIMAQYYPVHRARDYPELARRPTFDEVDQVLAQAGAFGLRRAGRH